MNARTPTPLAEPTVELIPIAALRPSRTHIQERRRKRFNAEAISELAASLLKVGQLQPIVVRPWNPAPSLNRVPSDPTHEIVLGERRFLACKQAGLAHIQASIRELNDAEVLEAQLIENLQREDLHPLEEAEGYRELMEAASIKKEDLGARIGKSRSWVYSRLKLLGLQPECREALETGRIDVSRAMVLARVGNKEHQLQMLTLATMTDPYGAITYSVRDLARQLSVEGVAISLQLAPFDTTDPTLGRGACTDCEYRSGNNDPENPDPLVCTDRSCYEKKAKTHGARRLNEALDTNQPVFRGAMAKEITTGKDRYVGFVDLDTLCDFDEFDEPEPKDIKGESEEHNQALYDAWEARANAHQPRTYRQLLGAEPWPFQTTLLEGKGKRVVELAPFKELQKHLKKEAQIQLPAHIAAKPGPQQAQPRYDYKAERAKQEEQRKQEQQKEKRERARRIAIWEAIGKLPKVLQKEHLHWAAIAVCNDWATAQGMKEMYGHDMRGRKDAMSASQLRDLLLLAPVAAEIGDCTRPSKALLALAKTCRIDVAKVLRELEAKDKPTEKKGGKK